MVFLLSGLCQDEAQMRKFLDGGGLDLLARLFDADNAGIDEQDRLRGKIANFIFDNFLQVDTTTKKLEFLNKDMDTDMNSQELKSQLDKEDPWVKLEAEGEEQVNTADLETNWGELKRDLIRWCPLFETSSTNIKSKSQTEMNPTTASALENIHSAHLALEKKLEARGSCSRIVNSDHDQIG